MHGEQGEDATGNERQGCRQRHIAVIGRPRRTEQEGLDPDERNTDDECGCASLSHPRRPCGSGTVERQQAHQDRIQWLASPTLAMAVLIFAELWKLTPFLALMALASMQAIPSSMYRAAAIDGANGWQRFWRMTLPNMRGTIMFLLIVQSMWSIKVFDTIYVLTGGSGGPAEATTTVNFLAYLTTFSYLDRGYGAAMSLAIMALVTLMALFWTLVLGRRREEAR